MILEADVPESSLPPPSPSEPELEDGCDAVADSEPEPEAEEVVAVDINGLSSSLIVAAVRSNVNWR